MFMTTTAKYLPSSSQTLRGGGWDTQAWRTITWICALLVGIRNGIRIYSSYLMCVCLLYTDRTVVLLTISLTLHANILAYLHKYISWYVSKFSFTAFFFPTSPLNLLQFCFATHRVRKNCSSTLSPLSRSNNSISCQCNCFQVFCSQVSTYKGLSHAATGGLGEKTADRYFCCLVLLLSLL